MKLAVIAFLFLNILGHAEINYDDYECKRIAGKYYMSGLITAPTWEVVKKQYPKGTKGESFHKQTDCEQALKVARENSNEVICTGSDLPIVGGYRLTDLWTGKTVQQKMEKDVCERMAKKSKAPYACHYNYSSKADGSDRKVTWLIANTQDQSAVAGFEFKTDSECLAKIAELAKLKQAEAAPKGSSGAKGKMDDPY